MRTGVTDVASTIVLLMMLDGDVPVLPLAHGDAGACGALRWFCIVIADTLSALVGTTLLLEKEPLMPFKLKLIFPLNTNNATMLPITHTIFFSPTALSMANHQNHLSQKM